MVKGAKILISETILLEELKEAISYNPDTGIFTRLIDMGRSGRLKAGEELSNKTDSDGYKLFTFQKKSYKQHRLAFLFMIGRFPKNQVDHINRIKTDNRWSNLREATPSQNQMNRKSQKKRAEKYSEYKGVHWNKESSKWRVNIRLNKKTIFIGYFNNEVEAAQAYDKKAIELFGEYAFINFSKTREEEN